VPTVLDALGVQPPEAVRGVPQAPIEGVSFAHTFDDADAPTQHETQYFEMMGHRAIYHDGWRAVCPWPGPSFTEAAEQGLHFGSPIPADTLAGLEASGWELYNLTGRRPATWPPSNPRSSPKWSPCGGTRPRSTRSCPSTAM
jgi:arylsulfatase